jgi:hypothetical protein
MLFWFENVSASAAGKLIPKEKKKKKKALSEGLDEWMQAFRLKNFPEQDF